MNRRHFLQTVSAAALASAAPRRAFAVAKKPRATADSVILLWVAGGMTHTETFDPKRCTPFTPGVEAASILSTFEAQPTALDGIFFSEGLEEIGKVMDRGTLIRSHTVAENSIEVGQDLKNQPAKLTAKKQYGLHRHFTGAGSVLMFGGGVKRDHGHGRTADERPCSAVENPVSIADLHQTIYHCLGSAPDTHYEIESRPFYTTPDGKGAVVKVVLA